MPVDNESDEGATPRERVEEEERVAAPPQPLATEAWVHRQPGARERATHIISHIPFQPWCHVCVKARAPNAHHRRGAGDHEQSVPEVHADYCFLRTPASEHVKVLVLIDRQSGYIMAHVVTHKGLQDETIAARILSDLNRIGRRGKLVLRSDQEPSVVQVLEEVARIRSRDSETIVEQSPAAESQSNGRIERAIRKFE